MSEMRNGMWVECDRGVGIFHVDKMMVKGVEEKLPRVHLIDSAGETTMIVGTGDVKELRQARAASIPAVRVGHITKAQLNAIGYA